MNAAVETETQPSIPPLIAQLLQKLELPYETCQDTPELAPASRVQAILLEDAAGALLVLFPRDHLLDLPRLAELTDRHLVAVTPERLSRMLDKHNLQ
ncbi:MAG TPA: histidine kinase, partial [Pseudomonas sp.]|nr:histidine kinase [Pseudomonas sp.]